MSNELNPDTEKERKVVNPESRNRRRTRRFVSEIFNFSDSDSSNIQNMVNMNLTKSEKSLDACETLKNMNPEQVRELFDQMRLNEQKSTDQDGVEEPGELDVNSKKNKIKACKAKGKENKENLTETSSISMGNEAEIVKKKETRQGVKPKRNEASPAEPRSSKQENLDVKQPHNNFETKTGLLVTIPKTKTATYEIIKDIEETGNQDVNPSQGKKEKRLKNTTQNCDGIDESVQLSMAKETNKFQLFANNSKGRAKSKTVNDISIVNSKAQISKEEQSRGMVETINGLVNMDQVARPNPKGKTYKQLKKSINDITAASLKTLNKVTEEPANEINGSQTPYLENDLGYVISNEETLSWESTIKTGTQSKNKSKTVQKLHILQDTKRLKAVTTKSTNINLSDKGEHKEAIDRLEETIKKNNKSSSKTSDKMQVSNSESANTKAAITQRVTRSMKNFT